MPGHEGTIVTNPVQTPGARIAEIHGDLVVDAGLAAMLRHHTGNADEFAAALEFCRAPASMRQLGILFAHMGDRLPILAEDVNIERARTGTVLRCDIRFDLHTRWALGRLEIGAGRFPDTMVSASYGRPLRAVLDHPYVPYDLDVLDVEATDKWVFIPTRRREGGQA